jgi:hypothetical protein
MEIILLVVISCKIHKDANYSSTQLRFSNAHIYKRVYNKGQDGELTLYKDAMTSLQRQVQTSLGYSYQLVCTHGTLMPKYNN